MSMNFYQTREEREERRERALKAEVEYLWMITSDPTVAEELVLHDEVGSDVVADLLRLAGRARTAEGRADAKGILAQLVALFDDDIQRIAKRSVERAFG
jgi:hypothetical protein